MSKYSIMMLWSKEDNCYIVSVPELKGCIAHGQTKEEALKEIETAKNLWIECALENGEELPKPNLFGTLKA